MLLLLAVQAAAFENPAARAAVDLKGGVRVMVRVRPLLTGPLSSRLLPLSRGLMPGAGPSQGSLNKPLR